MKNYLKEDLSEDEESEVKGIIWMVVRNYNSKKNQKLGVEMTLDDEISLSCQDLYAFEELVFRDYRDYTRPLTESEKTEIVNKLNMIMDEVRLSDLKRTMTFSEKLVFFFLFVEKYKANQVMLLLDSSRKTIYNRKKSIEKIIKEMRGELQ